MKKKPKIRMDATTILIIIVALVCVVIGVKTFITHQPAISANKEKVEEIKQNIEYEKQRIEEIDEVTQKVGTDEYTEKVAREKLGMIKADEIVFVDISGQK